jgi:hypothetical protein
MGGRPAPSSAFRGLRHDRRVDTHRFQHSVSSRPRCHRDNRVRDRVAFLVHPTPARPRTMPRDCARSPQSTLRSRRDRSKRISTEPRRYSRSASSVAKAQCAASFSTGNGRKPTSLPPQPGCWIVAPFVAASGATRTAPQLIAEVLGPQRITATTHASGAWCRHFSHHNPYPRRRTVAGRRALAAVLAVAAWFAAGHWAERKAIAIKFLGGSCLAHRRQTSPSCRHCCGWVHEP